MYIYNITINIDNEVREAWITWMKSTHMPAVMNTGCFIENRLFKVLVDEEQGSTYSVQYTFESMNNLQDYKSNHAAELQNKLNENFGNSLVSFSTVLEKV